MIKVNSKWADVLQPKLKEELIELYRNQSAFDFTQFHNLGPAKQIPAEFPDPKDESIPKEDF